MIEEVRLNDEQISEEREVESGLAWQNNRPVREAREKGNYKGIQDIQFQQRQGHRRRAQNDSEFKEVVQNFYDLITEINKQFKESKKTTKRIQKKPQARQVPEQKIPIQQQKLKKIKVSQEIEESEAKKNDLYRFKKDKHIDMNQNLVAKQKDFLDPYLFKQSNLQQFMQGGNPYTQQMMMQLNNSAMPTAPFMFEPQVFQNALNFRSEMIAPSMKQIEGQKGRDVKKFGRNAYHVAIAYHIYMVNTSQSNKIGELNLEDNYDPTFLAKKMRNNKPTPIHEGKKSDDFQSEIILESPQRDVKANTIIFKDIEESSLLQKKDNPITEQKDGDDF